MVICMLCNPAEGAETAAPAMGSEPTTIFMVAPMVSVMKPLCGRWSGSSPELPQIKPCIQSSTHSGYKERSRSHQ